MGGGTAESIHSLSDRSTEDLVHVSVLSDTDSPSSGMQSGAHSIEIERGTTQELARLLWSKSKVFLHPTARSVDNVPGWLSITQQSNSHVRLLSWLPEELVAQSDENERYIFVELDADSDVATASSPTLVSPPIIATDLRAFSIPLTALYSLLLQPPTLTSWYGSLQIFTTTDQSIPILFFHDLESRSTVLDRDRRAALLGTLGGSLSSNVPPSWGGEALIQQLRYFTHLLRSSLEPTLFLINPSKEDSEVHSSALFPDDEAANIAAVRGFTGVRLTQNHGSGRSILHQSLDTRAAEEIEYPDVVGAGMDNLSFSILHSFSKITRSARQAAQTAAASVLAHPLAKPILKNIPEPLAQFANVPGELTPSSQALARIQENAGVMGFDSARIYLAKWARVVAEEGERARRRERNGQSFDGRGKRGEEDSDFGPFEILASTYNIARPKTSRASASPIVLSEWKAWFDDDGKLLLDETEAKKRIFQRGLTDEARKRVWPFLLKVFPWTSNTKERGYMRSAMTVQYAAHKRRWQENPDVLDSERFAEEQHRVEIDCLRTDRTHPMFESPDLDPSEPFTVDNENASSHSSSNANVLAMQEILLTWVFGTEMPSPTSPLSSSDASMHQRNYVQSMSDLLAPIFVVAGGDHVEAYFGFSTLMERMKPNFLRDQSGIQKQLTELGGLIRIMDSAMWDHLESANSTNLFFSFRWILCSFKRELNFDDTMRLWENFWTEQYGNKFHLFVALAIIEQQRDVIIKYLRGFDEILKYINELSQTLDLDTILADAEVLYLTFKKVIESADARTRALDSMRAEDLRNTCGYTNTVDAPSEVESIVRGLLKG